VFTEKFTENISELTLGPEFCEYLDEGYCLLTGFSCDKGRGSFWRDNFLASTTIDLILISTAL
jgi:hypothetical protein